MFEEEPAQRLGEGNAVGEHRLGEAQRVGVPDNRLELGVEERLPAPEEDEAPRPEVPRLLDDREDRLQG